MKCLLVICVFLLCGIPSASAQKAYEVVQYAGKIDSISVTFNLADGYLAGSEILITNLRTKKISRFLPGSGVPGDDGTLTFYPEQAQQPAVFFILSGMNYVDEIPVKFSGSYRFNNKAVHFVITKRKGR